MNSDSTVKPAWHATTSIFGSFGLTSMGTVVLLVILLSRQCCLAGEEVVAVPDDLRPLAREAKESFERGDCRHAEELFQNMLSKHPDSVWILSNLAVTRFRLGKLKAAEETVRQALRL